MGVVNVVVGPNSLINSVNVCGVLVFVVYYYAKHSVE